MPIPGTCKEEPYEECVDLAKTKERQIACKYNIFCSTAQVSLLQIPSVKTSRPRSVTMFRLKSAETFLTRNVHRSHTRSAG